MHFVHQLLATWKLTGTNKLNDPRDEKFCKESIGDGGRIAVLTRNSRLSKSSCNNAYKSEKKTNKWISIPLLSKYSSTNNKTKTN